MLVEGTYNLQLDYFIFFILFLVPRSLAPHTFLLKWKKLTLRHHAIYNICSKDVSTNVSAYDKYTVIWNPESKIGFFH